MRVCLFFLLITSFGFGQNTDSLYQKKTLQKSQLKAVFGYYKQDGENSAVTGGVGTEELSVKSTRIIYVRKTKNENKWKFKVGVDQVTSASTDKINFIESSASLVDHRVQIQAGYTKVDSLVSKGVSIGSSIESEYWSRRIGFNYSKKLKKDVKFKFNFNYLWDDLRWGWVKLGQFQGEKLVYPIELRGTEWFDKHHRNSFSMNFSLDWYSSKRSTMAFVFTPLFQEGILSTPFHRVYFNDNSKRVENLPQTRLKLPLGYYYNYFLSNRLILKNYARVYMDNWGLYSGTYKLTLPIKLKYWIWLKPFVRFYSQNGLGDFAEYGGHSIASEFYTSDYDFSKFSSYNYGMKLKFGKRTKLKWLNGFELVVDNYNRSDGLKFWQSAFIFDFKF